MRKYLPILEAAFFGLNVYFAIADRAWISILAVGFMLGCMMTREN